VTDLVGRSGRDAAHQAHYARWCSSATHLITPAEVTHIVTHHGVSFKACTACAERWRDGEGKAKIKPLVEV